MSGITLKMARAKANLTQKEMSDKLGVSRVTYGEYENYNVPMRIDTAIQFSKVVDIPFDDIIFLQK